MMTKEIEETNSDLVETFITLESLLHRHFERNRRKKGPFGNPHKGQGRVLSLLKLQPTITQKELSFLLDMRPQSLGELLSKLESAHYITREPAADDRRIMMIQLTDAGKQAAELIDQNQVTDTVFDRLSPDEQATFQLIMQKLITELEKEIPSDMRREFGGMRGGRPNFDGSFGRGSGRRHRGPFPEQDGQ